MDVGRTLLEARKAAGLSQRQLAARAGVPQSTVARIELRQLMPRVDTFDRLLRASESMLATAELPGRSLTSEALKDEIENGSNT